MSSVLGAVRLLATPASSATAFGGHALVPASALCATSRRSRKRIRTRRLGRGSLARLRSGSGAGLSSRRGWPRARLRPRTISWIGRERGRSTVAGATSATIAGSTRSTVAPAGRRKGCGRRTPIPGIRWWTVTWVSGLIARVAWTIAGRTISPAVVAAAPVAVSHVNVSVIDDRMAMPVRAPVTPSPTAAAAVDRRPHDDSATEGDDGYGGTAVVVTRNDNRRAIYYGGAVNRNVDDLRIRRLYDDGLRSRLLYLYLDPDFRFPAASAFARIRCTAAMTSACCVAEASPSADVHARFFDRSSSTDGNCVSAFTEGSHDC